MFSKPLRSILSTEGEIDDAALISIDSKGTDVRVRQGAQVSPLKKNFTSLFIEYIEHTVINPYVLSTLLVVIVFFCPLIDFQLCN